jgi:hypothetical protein
MPTRTRRKRRRRRRKYLYFFYRSMRVGIRALPEGRVSEEGRPLPELVDDPVVESPRRSTFDAAALPDLDGQGVVLVGPRLEGR